MLCPGGATGSAPSDLRTARRAPWSLIAQSPPGFPATRRVGAGGEGKEAGPAVWLGPGAKATAPPPARQASALAPEAVPHGPVGIADTGSGDPKRPLWGIPSSLPPTHTPLTRRRLNEPCCPPAASSPAPESDTTARLARVVPPYSSRTGGEAWASCGSSRPLARHLPFSVRACAAGSLAGHSAPPRGKNEVSPGDMWSKGD